MEISSGKYKHYKGGIYEVLFIGILESSMEKVVIYKSLEGKGEIPAGQIWVRTLKSFTEKINVCGKLINRFELVQ